MWQIDNRTPFACERGWTRDENGMELWLVAVKATFDIRLDGSTEVAAVQPPVLLLPEYHGKEAKSSIKYEADLVLAKATTDIIVVGHAHSQSGRAVRQLDVGFRVGPVKRILKVFGDRRWSAFGPTEPEAFTRMPLVYERAFGGVDALSRQQDRDWDGRNPLGCGFAVEKASLEGMPLPNIEMPDHLVRGWDDRPPPAGFGAIASHWQPRASFAGTYDEAWLKTRHPLLPKDFDRRFFQYAPQDQQAPDFLLGGEPVNTFNLSPHGNLRFTLPRLHLGFESRFYDGTREIHANRKLHSVILEPDFPRVSLVWHSALPCHFKNLKLQRTIVSLKTNLSADSAASHEPQLEGELS